MAVEQDITKEVRNNAIDMLVPLIVEELVEDLNIEPDEAFFKFVSSKTGELLYDKDSNLWWNGPSYIVELYEDEMKEAGDFA